MASLWPRWQPRWEWRPSPLVSTRRQSLPLSLASIDPSIDPSIYPLLSSPPLYHSKTRTVPHAARFLGISFCFLIRPHSSYFGSIETLGLTFLSHHFSKVRCMHDKKLFGRCVQYRDATSVTATGMQEAGVVNNNVNPRTSSMNPLLMLEPVLSSSASWVRMLPSHGCHEPIPQNSHTLFFGVNPDPLLILEPAVDDSVVQVRVGTRQAHSCAGRDEEDLFYSVRRSYCCAWIAACLAGWPGAPEQAIASGQVPRRRLYQDSSMRKIRRHSPFSCKDNSA